jgi:sulfhydrogenase subunit gamma (sulfur reductase)
MSTRQNPYLPLSGILEKISIENDAKDLKTFRIVFTNHTDKENFRFECGQFAMLSAPGAGECPIGIASSPLERDYIEFTMKRYPDGLVSSAFHALSVGDTVGVRGPFGRAFPMKLMEGKNVVIVGGGFAFTTLRATINYMLHDSKRSLFKNITIVYGARSAGELLYKDELAGWEKRKDVTTFITVDKADAGWKGREGFVPQVLKDAAPAAANSVMIICGPPIMLKFTLPVARELGFADDAIFTSLERKMSCGIGKCGRCNIDSKYVCKDGPVFAYSELAQIRESVF